MASNLSVSFRSTPTERSCSGKHLRATARAHSITAQPEGARGFAWAAGERLCKGHQAGVAGPSRSIPGTSAPHSKPAAVCSRCGRLVVRCNEKANQVVRAGLCNCAKAGEGLCIYLHMVYVWHSRLFLFIGSSKSPFQRRCLLQGGRRRWRPAQIKWFQHMPTNKQLRQHAHERALKQWNPCFTNCLEGDANLSEYNNTDSRRRALLPRHAHSKSNGIAHGFDNICVSLICRAMVCGCMRTRSRCCRRRALQTACWAWWTASWYMLETDTCVLIYTYTYIFLIHHSSCVRQNQLTRNFLCTSSFTYYAMYGACQSLAHAFSYNSSLGLKPYKYNFHTLAQTFCNTTLSAAAVATEEVIWIVYSDLLSSTNLNIILVVFPCCTHWFSFITFTITPFFQLT